MQSDVFKLTLQNLVFALQSKNKKSHLNSRKKKKMRKSASNRSLSIFIATLLIALAISASPTSSFSLTQKKPTACRRNPKFNLKPPYNTPEIIGLICQPHNIPSWQPKTSQGCTYLEPYDDCVTDDSTLLCAYFTVKGCTHCWEYVQIQPKSKEKEWKIQPIGRAVMDLNYCIVKFRSQLNI